ncbi:type 1 glutamine amidotransferase [Roseovarius sp. 2305UL8-3]|uniref:type 1 glutamine amidotransferase n=1 Tax=Roseovarius conchicola TaxID=3121636 RepID=UPI00352796C7
MKIGILMTGHAVPEVQPTLGDYDAFFARLLDGHGFEYAVYDCEGGVIPNSPEECDGWLITGSKHGAYEDHPWIPPLEEFIRKVYATDRPMVGICFGHQIIAQALGGKVVKYDGGWSIGQTTYEIEGQTLGLNAWHQDQVVELPEDAQVIGSSDFCANAALVYGDKVYTIQPHPEFESDMIDFLVKYRGPGVVPDAILEHAANRLDAPTHNPVIAERIANFLKKGG